MITIPPINVLRALIPVGILFITAVLFLCLGVLIGRAFMAAEMQPRIINLTQEVGLLNTSLATCEGGVRALEQATMSAGRAREQAEMFSAELTKRNQRIVASVKTIQASSCLDMVGQLIALQK